MNCSHLLFAVLLIAPTQQLAWGHFIWIDAKPIEKDAPVELYFSEVAAPGEKHLINRIAGTKVWLRDADGKTTPIAVKVANAEASAKLTGNCSAAGPVSLEAFYDYGVYSHGGPGILVQYYAKHLPAQWLHDPKLVKSDKLRFDVIPSIADGKLTLHVNYDGKPVVNRELVVNGPAEKRHDLMTDAEGKVTIPGPNPGRYAVQAGNIEMDKSGERDGKKYVQTWHYSTLIFELPAAAIGSKPAKLNTPE